MEYELIGNELTYLRPRNKKKEILEAILGGLLIVLFTAGLLWVFTG